jgi:hypothetical protein
VIKTIDMELVKKTEREIILNGMVDYCDKFKYHKQERQRAFLAGVKFCKEHI